MLNYESIKKLCKTVYDNKRYIHTFHLHNAYLTYFSYTEFENKKLDFSEMVMIPLFNEAKFLERKMEDICIEVYFEPPLKGWLSTEEDLLNMKFMMNDVISMSDGLVGKNSWNDNRNRDIDSSSDEIVGYYLNHEWKSNDFPKELIDKIVSADKCTTLINENSILMIVLEHNGKQSLFYSMNDQ